MRSLLMICRRPAEFAFLRKISNLKRSDSEPGQLKCAIERPFGLSRYTTTANFQLHQQEFDLVLSGRSPSRNDEYNFAFSDKDLWVDITKSL